MSTNPSSLSYPMLITESVTSIESPDVPPRALPSRRGPRPQRSKDRDDLKVAIDPFLAQYMKPITKNNHEVYFSAINNLQHIQSYDYYQKYLNVRKIDSKPPLDPKTDPSISEKQASLLATAVSAETHDLQASRKDLVSQSRRRRKSCNEAPVQIVSKKAHPEVTTKRLPLQFIECPTTDLIDIVTRMIHSLVTLNDRSVPLSVADRKEAGEITQVESKKLLTRYHSRTPPTLSISTYLSRLTKFNHFTQTTLLTTIYYIDLLSLNYQPYFMLNSWTVHRFLLVATMIAQKSLEDFFYTNDHYAKVGGVALTELNCLELDFLHRVDWKVIPAKQILPTQTSIRYSKEVLDLYYRQLVSLMGKNVSEQNNTVYSMADA